MLQAIETDGQSEQQGLELLHGRQPTRALAASVRFTEENSISIRVWRR
jgi:hypothetical protein